MSLDSTFVAVNTYAVPPKADQKVGDIPLGDCINDTTTTITSLGTPFTGCWKALFAPPEPAHTEVESNHVDTNDSRMQQVIYADGLLYGELDTAVNIGGATKAGVAYYVISPRGHGNAPKVVRQGVLGLENNNHTYPAIGVNKEGRGMIAFTLLGADYFPSAAYVSFDLEEGTGPIQVAATGLGPEDGFTAYVAYVGNTRNRWATDGVTMGQPWPMICGLRRNTSDSLAASRSTSPHRLVVAEERRQHWEIGTRESRRSGRRRADSVIRVGKRGRSVVREEALRPFFVCVTGAVRSGEGNRVQNAHKKRAPVG